ncbi:MAG: argininosuccinate synthase, partial [Planctomycetaceae bacterium]
SDENCLHTSYEAGALEELTTDGFGLVEFGMTVSPREAPEAGETVTIQFERGVPVRVNGKTLPAHEIVLELNRIGGRNGIGRTDIVENRLVGMKSRGVYEAPGMTLLYEAHRLVEQMTLDRDLVHLRDRLSPEVAEMVYYGFWFCAKMDALLAFIREAQKPVTGSVELNLYRGNVLVKSRGSRESLYDAAIASMEGGGSYDQTDAEGFLRILGLPLRVQGRVRPRKG